MVRSKRATFISFGCLLAWSGCEQLREGPLPGSGVGGGSNSSAVGGDTSAAGVTTGGYGGATSGGRGGSLAEPAGSTSAAGTLDEGGAAGRPEGGAAGAREEPPPCTLASTPLGESCALELPSCANLSTKCGSASESCCTSTYLPGNEYIRSYDMSQTALQDGVAVVGVQESTTTPASMQPFWLDRYEATVGRFRNFLREYDAWRQNKPFTGDGLVLDVNGTGWNAALMNPSLPETAAVAKVGLMSTTCGAAVTWTDEPSGKEDYPITCVSWFMAFAFCIWDGGRLPTEAEWNYAAAGGPQQRSFPWSDPASASATPTRVQANLQGSTLVAVGHSAKALWGHQDLAGNAFEWTRDACTDCNIPGASSPGHDLDVYLDRTCIHCVHTEGPNQIIRGGSYKWSFSTGRTAYRAGNAPRNPYDDIGFRCARNPDP